MVDKINEKHEKIQKLVNQYLNKVGIGNITSKNEVEKFLNITQNEIRHMSDQDCGEAAIILNQEATYLQLEINKMQSDINWCNEYINFLIAHYIESCGGKFLPYEYRRTIAIKQNDIAKQLQEIVNNVKIRLDSVLYIPNYLQELSKSFEYLQNTKKNQRG